MTLLLICWFVRALTGIDQQHMGAHTHTQNRPTRGRCQASSIHATTTTTNINPQPPPLRAAAACAMMRNDELVQRAFNYRECLR